MLGPENSIGPWPSEVSGEYGVRGPHFFVKYSERLRPPPTRELLGSIREDWETPMQKLTNHEVKLADVGPESCYRVLLEETRRRARGFAVGSAGGGVGPALAAMSAAPRPAVLRRLLAPGADVGCH
ncbi:unnamed protein product [Prorocentrum cordatum]|uniref:Uncharacterized protein n=1 Tax=Prorocentrum cordatum TaxID=2364126 RepID=A0ABN9SSM4_9DINO|nr:unnamed protein product [Polarella glacialis]